MRIYSNKLSRSDIRDAAQEIPQVLHEIRHTFTPRRTFAWGFDVVLFSSRLEGRASAGMPGWIAATWDEFGIFIDKLFAIDPDAKIAGYDGREDFIAKTTDDYNRRKLYGHDRSKVEAPWLVKN